MLKKDFKSVQGIRLTNLGKKHNSDLKELRKNDLIPLTKNDVHARSVKCKFFSSLGCK